jgi:plasmid stability protein
MVIARRRQEETMAQVLVRDLDERVVARLKARAASEGRSLEAEVRLILTRAAETDWTEARAAIGRVRDLLAGRAHSDGVELLRQDRAR